MRTAAILLVPLIAIGIVLWRWRKTIRASFRNLLVAGLAGLALYMWFLKIGFGWGEDGVGRADGADAGANSPATSAALPAAGADAKMSEVVYMIEYDAGAEMLRIEGIPSGGEIFRVSVASGAWPLVFRKRLEALRMRWGVPCVLKSDPQGSRIPIPAWNALREAARACDCSLVCDTAQ